MNKTIARLLKLSLGVGLVYFAGVGFYAEKFSANTTFGTVDISHLTLSQAQEKIEDDFSNQVVSLTEGGQTVAEISLEDLDLVYHTQQALEATYQSQDPTAWVIDLFDSNHYDQNMADQVAIDSSDFQELLVTAGIDNSQRQPAIDASIQYSDTEGYYTQAGAEGTQIDADRLFSELIESVQGNGNTVALEDTYTQPQITLESPILQDTMQEIQELSAVEITLDLAGDMVTIPQKTIESWIYFDENNQIILDGEAVAAYLSQLNEQYASFDKPREFMSTNQGLLTVDAGTLGWGIDVETETANLIQDILAGNSVTRQPAIYSSGGDVTAADGIGDTYVEVDLSYQAMYLYVDGQLIVSTPIVSGQPGAETVPGAYAVNEKLTDTKLRGYNHISKKSYETPVSYWIRFDYNAQGIHDATWQAAFGGDVHLYAGSLGCINTPLDIMSIIYDYVDYGTPVLVFY